MTDWKKRALGTRRRGHTVWVRIVEKEEGLDCLGVDHGLKTGFELFGRRLGIIQRYSTDWAWD